MILITLCLSACATNKITAQQVNNIKNKRIVVATFEPATLEAITGTQAALLGPFTAFTSRMTGHSIVEKNNIPDPAVGMVKKLSQKLSDKYNLDIVNDDPLENLPVPDLNQVATVNNADLILMGKTTLMNSIYFFTDANNYKTTIAMWVIFKDPKTGKDVLTAGCMHKPEYETTNDAPSWDYLYENGALGFKNIIEDAQNYCVDKFLSEDFIF